MIDRIDWMREINIMNFFLEFEKSANDLTYRQTFPMIKLLFNWYWCSLSVNSSSISASAIDLISEERFEINKAAYRSCRIANGFLPEKFSKCINERRVPVVAKRQNTQSLRRERLVPWAHGRAHLPLGGISAVKKSAGFNSRESRRAVVYYHFFGYCGSPFSG